MDYRDEINDRINAIMESNKLYCEYIGVNEGLIARLKQMKADKKARKAAEAERKRQQAEEEAEKKRLANEARKEKAKANAMKNYPIVDDSVARKDLDDFIGKVHDILKREIPGVRLEPIKIGHNKKQLDEGYVMHKLHTRVFVMNDKNLKSFLHNTRDKNIKLMNGANKAMKIGNTINTVATLAGVGGGLASSVSSPLQGMTDNKLQKMIDGDFNDRIIDPIIGMGFRYKKHILISYKEGQEYLFVKKDSFHFGYTIEVGITYITKP